MHCSLILIIFIMLDGYISVNWHTVLNTMIFACALLKNHVQRLFKGLPFS